MNDLDCILVGILAERDDLPPDRDLVTFVNKIGEIQFALKIISDGPESLHLDKTITCYANKFRDYEFEDDYYEDWPIRARKFEAFLMDKIVLFRPSEQRKKGETLYVAEPVMVLPKPVRIDTESRLIPMLHLNQKSEEDYEALLLKQSPLGPFRYYPLQMPKVDPIYVYVNGYLYGSFYNRVERHKKWVYEFNDEIMRVPYDLLEQESIITFGEVAFVESFTYLKDFQAMLDSDGEVISPKTFMATEVEENNKSAETQETHGESEDFAETVSAEAEKSNEPAGNKDEEKFIYRLDRLCRASGLLYDEDDLLNFHTALKVGGLVILAGMSGTGKSHLVRMYSEALGLNENSNNGRFKFLPVRPNWVDDTDLIGFLDTANNIYRPADTGIVNLLLEAEGHPDRLYLFCLDEMNLARVEHYFGQFLSILELPEKNRSLQLYNPELKDRIYNSSQYPPQIKIGSNVCLSVP
ncbi:MAG: hypothetical protein FH756_08455 [Firmicutes bacterium]|nr:hypothetical protein [Bacillota bacterium]